MFLVDMIFTDMNKITANLTSKHKHYLEQEYQSNKLMFGGRKVPRNGGILISQHESRELLESILKSDPFIINGAATYTITEFIPVMASKDYEDIIA